MSLTSPPTLGVLLQAGELLVSFPIRHLPHLTLGSYFFGGPPFA